ncbi:hypothetical protein UPYG_G00326740 [Umbra pygmaea]|uniref:Coiled-coil SMC6 And NSE5 INteracting (CANIN) domain-containing protein n=1 Tax=Umbra pygmaea TaxID=75934 RepID=A0ABD0W2C1_UMBPY
MSKLREIIANSVKDVIPLGCPHPKQPLTPSSPQETPRIPSLHPRCHSTPNAQPLHKWVKPRVKASPQSPRPSGVPPRTSESMSDAKCGPTHFTNTTDRMQPLYGLQSSCRRPVTPHPFNHAVSMDYRGLASEEKNMNLKVGPSDGESIRHPFSMTPAFTSRPGQSSSLHASPHVDPRNQGISPRECRDHYSQKLTHLHDSNPKSTAERARKDTVRIRPLSPTVHLPVTLQQSHRSLDYRGMASCNDRFTAGGTKSLSLKRRRRPDYEGCEQAERGQEMARKKGHLESSSPHSASDGTSVPASSMASLSPKVYVKSLFIKTSPNPSSALKLMSHCSPKKTARVLEKEGVVSQSTPLPVSRYGASSHANNQPVRSRGSGEHGRATKGKAGERGPRGEQQISRPGGENKPVSSSKISDSKIHLDPKIYSASVRLDSCGINANSQSSSVKPSLCKEKRVKMAVASGAVVSPAISTVNVFADESVKTGAGLGPSGIPSVVVGRSRDENANLSTPESSSRKTVPLSTDAVRPSRSKCGSFSMEVEDPTNNPHNSLPHSSPSAMVETGGREDEVSEGGNPKFQRSLSFLGEESLDVALGLDQSLGLEFELSQTSSSSSEEDQLPSLQQILDDTARPPDTPVKGAYPAPSTPVGPRRPSQTLVFTKDKPTSYRNNLDEMLKESKSIQRCKDVQKELLLSCEVNLQRLNEEEKSTDNTEEAISQEQKEFLQRFSVVSDAIRDLRPGEAVFNMEDFGRLFNQHTLQLRHCNVTPQNTAQKTLLWSSPDQFKFQVCSELFQAAYRSSPCPAQVTRWLFKMMSVHGDMLTSLKVLKALKDIACSAAGHIALNKSEQFEVWVPSVADVTLVIMNMGVPFITMFPLEDLQPVFTEGDLIEGIQIRTKTQGTEEQLSTFPEHNLDGVIEYLCVCTSLCPRAYSDRDLLLLLTLLSKVSLDTQFSLQPVDGLRSLLHNLLNAIRDMDIMLPRICTCLIHLTEDHHNLRWLVEILPDSTRGQQLRRHLSMSAISKLLNNRCTYKASNTEFQLTELRRYLPQMRPSLLLRGLADSSRRGQSSHREKAEEENSASLDQQAYYLCYSLLALANQATMFEFFPAKQKNQLLLLCAELEKYIKCDIRESEKMLYRSKVKDFVARVYTKWQVLVQKSRPLQGKLYDYWEPLPEDAVTSSQETNHSLRPTDEETVMELGEQEKGEDKSDEEKDRILEMDLAMEEEEENTFLKMDGLEEEEERMGFMLDESDKESKMEDMNTGPTEWEAEERATEEEVSEERGKEPIEERDKLQKVPEIEESRCEQRDPGSEGIKETERSAERRDEEMTEGTSCA